MQHRTGQRRPTLEISSCCCCRNQGCTRSSSFHPPSLVSAGAASDDSSAPCSCSHGCVHSLSWRPEPPRPLSWRLLPSLRRRSPPCRLASYEGVRLAAACRGALGAAGDGDVVRGEEGDGSREGRRPPLPCRRDSYDGVRFAAGALAGAPAGADDGGCASLEKNGCVHSSHPAGAGEAALEAAGEAVAALQSDTPASARCCSSKNGCDQSRCGLVVPALADQSLLLRSWGAGRSSPLRCRDRSPLERRRGSEAACVHALVLRGADGCWSHELLEGAGA